MYSVCTSKQGKRELIYSTLIYFTQLPPAHLYFTAFGVLFVKQESQTTAPGGISH